MSSPSVLGALTVDCSLLFVLAIPSHQISNLILTSNAKEALYEYYWYTCPSSHCIIFLSLNVIGSWSSPITLPHIVFPLVSQGMILHLSISMSPIVILVSLPTPMLPCQFSRENINGILNRTLLCYKLSTILVTNVVHQKNIEIIGKVFDIGIIGQRKFKCVYSIMCPLIIIPSAFKAFLDFWIKD